MTAGMKGPDWSGRLARLQAEIGSRDLDAFVVSSTLNLLYLTGFSATAGLLVATAGDLRLVIDRRYDASARGWFEANSIAIQVAAVERRYDLSLAEALSAMGARRVGFEASDVRVATLQAWERAFPDRSWIATERVIESHRLIKDDWEQALYREGGRRVASVARQVPDIVRPGLTERQIAAVLERELLAVGFSRLAFPSIVASGPNSALPHVRPTERVVAAGDLVVLDFGGVLDGYCLDLTRTVGVEWVSDEALALYDAVQSAHTAALVSIAPGVDASAVDEAARKTLEQRGLGHAFLHGTGHGLGLEIHEAPRVARADPDVRERLEAGMVFTVEPGAYVETVGGVRLEDDVLVTAGGCEVLTEAPRELLVV